MIMFHKIGFVRPRVVSSISMTQNSFIEIEEEHLSMLRKIAHTEIGLQQSKVPKDKRQVCLDLMRHGLIEESWGAFYGFPSWSVTSKGYEVMLCHSNI